MQQEQFTFDDLKQILVTRVGVPEHRIPDDRTTTFEAIGLDSLAIVDLQLAIQQRYDIQIDDDDARDIKTIGAAIDFTNRRLGERDD